jgi:hypothetical protein
VIAGMDVTADVVGTTLVDAAADVSVALDDEHPTSNRGMAIIASLANF